MNLRSLWRAMNCANDPSAQFPCWTHLASIGSRIPPCRKNRRSHVHLAALLQAWRPRRLLVPRDSPPCRTQPNNLRHRCSGACAGLDRAGYVRISDRFRTCIDQQRPVYKCLTSAARLYPQPVTRFAGHLDVVAELEKSDLATLRARQAAQVRTSFRFHQAGFRAGVVPCSGSGRRLSHGPSVLCSGVGCDTDPQLHVYFPTLGLVQPATGNQIALGVTSGEEIRINAWV